MKVSKAWLVELVDIKDIKEVERLLPLRTIAIKEITPDFIELDMKGYNRADLLSMRGVALEVAAITDSKVKFEEPKEADYFWVEESFPKIEVSVENEELAPVYTLTKIEGLTVGPSPDSWVKKLTDSGVRSINNVADITNLIMLGYGQPLHSFDGDKVRGTVSVRVAKPNEKIKTLDDKDRNLETSDLLIADNEKAIGIAGVMGGANTEVTETTNTILLEAAIFDPKNLRKTAQRLGLTSEASKRFQHGLTRKRLLQALNAAVKMYQEIGGQVNGLTIIGRTEDQLKKVPLTLEKINSLIGVDFTEKQVENYLKKLNFELNKIEDGKWVVTLPYYRLDIEIEEDLVEEVARMYGYEKIPAKPLEGELPEKIDQSLFENIYDTKKTLVEIGLTEIQTYSFFSSKAIINYQLSTANLIKIANPISSETEYMRDHIWPNLVEVIEKNIKQGYSDIAIFEIGKVYYPTPLRGSDNDHGNFPKEIYHLAMALMNGLDNPVNELLEILNQFASKLKLDLSFSKDNQVGEKFHPLRYRRIENSGQDIGKIAEVHPRILNKFGIEKRVAILEISLP